MMNNKIPAEPIVLGKIGSCYGVRGWFRIYSYTEIAKNIFNYRPWFIQKKINKWEELYLENWRCHNRGIIIKLKNISDRCDTYLLTNCEIIVDSSQLPELRHGNYYWKDLIGCKVINTLGYDLGKVINMIETKSNDILIVQANLNDKFNVKERLIPFLEGRFVKKVNLNTETIEVDWEI